MQLIRSKKNTLTIIALFVMMSYLLQLSVVWSAPGQKLKDKFVFENIQLPQGEITIGNERSYLSVLKDYENRGYKPYNGEQIVVETKLTESSLHNKLESAYKGYDGTVLIWDDRKDSYTWVFSVPEDGLYNISIDYYAIKSVGGIPPVRTLKIDHQPVFNESYSFIFYKYWEEASKPLTNSNGDEVRSKLIQKEGWNSITLHDLNGMHPNPLMFPLSKGVHELTLGYVDGDMAIGKIVLSAPVITKPYKEVEAEYKARGYKYATGSLRIEAEESQVRNDPVLRRSYDGDPKCTPFEYGKIRLNVISGAHFKKGNQKVSWIVDAPEDGLYKISMRIAQVNGDGLYSYRQVLVDGKVPFAEFEAYPFRWSRQWQIETLSDVDGNPYLIYLTKGKHEISLEVKMGNMASGIWLCEALNRELSHIVRSITKITGSEPDLNFHYELDKKVPSLMEDLKRFRENLAAMSALLRSNAVKNPAAMYSFLSIEDSIGEIINNPDIIPSRMNDLISNQSVISQWYLDLKEMPLTIDYIQLTSPEEKVKLVRANFFDRLKATIANFFVSFSKDYNNVRLMEETGGKPVKATIDVWVARGREWSEIIQRMADEDFTPDSGVVVRINVMPAGSAGAVGGVSPLLLAVSSGKTPDVVLGSDSQTPVELAIRASTADLSSFDGFDDVAERYLPEMFTPLKFRGGVYALPETAEFQVMYYRTDIFEELNLRLPDTWDELYRYVLPVLKQNNCDFYYGGGYLPLLYQNGGSIYRADGKYSALDDNKAFAAFDKWIKNYTIYDLPRVANFFNHFRAGDIPIGIGGFNDYVMLSVAAPELFGKWGIYPIPGTRKADKSIDRSSAGGCSTSVMLENSTQKKAAWEFMKWWSSAETQIQFGTEVESTIGPEARWNTANIEAFQKLPWNKTDLQVIMESWKWYKEMPVVPGGYMTGRHIGNAWTRVVLMDENPRDSLEKAVKDINKELYKKFNQYGLWSD